MKNFFLKFIIILGGCLVISPYALAKKIFLDSSHPPPGFELATISQHLRVSVLFMNQYIGFFYIELQDGQLKFNSPRLLLSQLSNVKNNHEVLTLLNQSFPLNIECAQNNIATQPDFCQQLKKMPAYIIYDPKQEIVYLNLASVYFKKPQERQAIDYIPYPTAGWSYLNKLGAAGSFSDGSTSYSRIYAQSPNYYNLYSNNILAYGNNSLIGNVTQNNGINNGQHFQVQNLYAQHIVQDKIYSEGYISNQISPFFQTQTILGAGIKTTLETVKNPELIMTTPLVIFVPQASSVSIFKNAQLIFSQYFEAGYQRINTNSFPEGGYELTIKIGENNITHRFFTKGFSLPPEHAPQFYLIGGYLTNGMILNDNYHFLPKTLDIPVIQGGINKRINEQVAWLGDVLLNSHQELLDVGLSFYLGNSFTKTAILMTTQNAYGIYAMFNTQKNRINMSFIATKIHYQKRNKNYVFLNNLTDNDSISLSYNLSDEDLIGVQANYTKSLSQPHSYNAGAFYQRDIGNYKGMRFFFNTSYNKAIYVGDTYNLSLNVSFSHDNFAGTESLLAQHQMKNTRDNQMAVPAVIQGNTLYSHLNEEEVGYSINEIHTLSSTVTSLAGTYDYTDHQGFAAAYINYNKIKNEKNSTGYGGNVETEFAVNRHGAGLNGIHRGNLSGMIIRVNSSNAKDNASKFALVDEYNRKIAILPLNKKVFISQPEFTDQNYTLVNLSKVDYFIKQPTRHITLYPGNIGYYAWQAEKRIIVIGRAITKHHKPLVNTWIHAGGNGIFSDNEGNFQLELAENTKTLTADSCTIHLPKLNINKTYLYLGEAICY